MGLFSDDDSFGPVFDNLARNRGLYEQIDLPEYDEWSPELYTADSANYQLTGEDPVTKSNQLSLLQKMAGLAETGESDADKAGFMNARNMGNQMARAGTDAAIQNAQNRGAAGGGMEFAMREMANQQGAQRAQEAGLNQAATSAANRQRNLQAYAQGLGNVRDQDYRANAGNTDIINKFNMANTQQRNQVGQANAGLKNDAFQYNQNLKDKNYNNQTGKADRIAGINNQEAEARAAQAAQADAKRRAMMGLVGAGAGAVIGAGSGNAGTGAQVGSQVGQQIY